MTRLECTMYRPADARMKINVGWIPNYDFSLLLEMCDKENRMDRDWLDASCLPSPSPFSKIHKKAASAGVRLPPLKKKPASLTNKTNLGVSTPCRKESTLKQPQENITSKAEPSNANGTSRCSTPASKVTSMKIESLKPKPQWMSSLVNFILVTVLEICNVIIL